MALKNEASVGKGRPLNYDYEQVVHFNDDGFVHVLSSGVGTERFSPSRNLLLRPPVVLICSNAPRNTRKESLKLGTLKGFRFFRGELKSFWDSNGTPPVVNFPLLRS